MVPRGRGVLVVGATGRLGVAIAQALQKRGDRVILTARNPNKLEALSAEMGRGGEAPPFVTADLSHPDTGTTRPYTNHVAYLTAKGAVQTGLRALAVELAPDVRVNVVQLGVVVDPDADRDPLRTHRLAARSPLGRFGTADEVVHVVLALLDATSATGEIWGVGR